MNRAHPVLNDGLTCGRLEPTAAEGLNEALPIDPLNTFRSNQVDPASDMCVCVFVCVISSTLCRSPCGCVFVSFLDSQTSEPFSS